MKADYSIIASACLFLLPGCKGDKQKESPRNKPNVLFICVDDLRRDLGCYGTKVISPNIDRLAEQGSLFFNHYVQVPTSGASRASMLTGTLPREKADLSNEACRTRLSGKPEADAPGDNVSSSQTEWILYCRYWKNKPLCGWIIIWLY